MSQPTNNDIQINQNDDGTYGWNDNQGNSGTGYRTSQDAQKDADDVSQGGY